MTLRRDMIRALARAPRLLNDSTDLVRAFVLCRQADNGGIIGRDSRPDLYYTVFGLELLIALECSVPIDSHRDYLGTFDHGQALDLVHLASLARCHANLADATSGTIEAGLRGGLADRLWAHRCKDGSFSTGNADDHGNAYGCFLAVAMCQDLGISVPDPESVIKCLKALVIDDGGFANETTGGKSTTPSTAAALCTCHMLGHPLPAGSADWLMNRIHPHGGFSAASADSPLYIPDLLSTATALQALSYTRAAVTGHERHLDFIDSLWNPEGGFSGSWADPTPDCEYTYYGLLALGYLADIS